MIHKKDFPIFKNNKGLIYLDSSATSQKPKTVIDSLKKYYETYNSNVRRGLYSIAEKATEEVEEVRRKVAKFINATSPEEIIFVRNTTEAINLVAYSFGTHFFKKGDAITTTIMEHHSNFVPWQQLAAELKLKLQILDIDKNYELDSANFPKTDFLAITHVSNVLGTINPVKEIIKKARKLNPKVKVLVDAAQSVPHMEVDVKNLDCDFLVFSGHKMLAGMGVGVLWGKKEILSRMKPFLLGGEMISEVKLSETKFLGLPYRFEAGTPSVADIISLGAAIDYLSKIGMEKVVEHEKKLTEYALEKLGGIRGLKIYGSTNLNKRAGILSFTLDDIHPHDVAQYLGDKNICVRSGHNCAMPLHTRLGLPATVRASFYIYNEEKDIDELVEGLIGIKGVFKNE